MRWSKIGGTVWRLFSPSVCWFIQGDPICKLDHFVLEKNVVYVCVYNKLAKIVIVLLRC